MTKITIQKLSTADAEDYRFIRLLTLKTEPAYFGVLYEDEANKPLGSFVTTLTTDLVLGAYTAGAIVAVARLHGCHGVKERHKCSMHGVFVHPDHRGRGIGSALVSAVLDAARVRYERVILNVVADNVSAISLYQRLGFVTFGIEPCARRYQGVDTDVVSMGLRLVQAAGRSTA